MNNPDCRGTLKIPSSWARPEVGMASERRSSSPLMPYQFVREPLRPEEADRLCHACRTTDEKLVIWTLLDTGGYRNCAA